MRCVRLLVTLVLLMLALPTQSNVLAQAGEANPDLAAIPLAPDDLEKAGYLLEGGGYLNDPAAVGTLIGSLTGIEVTPSAVGELQRSYMLRLVLLFDRLDPGSELLADEITLVHQFATTEEADQFVTLLTDSFDETSERLELVDGVDSHRLVVESADSLGSTFAVDRLVLQVISTDLTGSSDQELHGGASDRRNHRRVVVTGGAVPDGAPSDLGIVQAFESQQIVTLNTGDSIVFQSWIASFADKQVAEEFAATLPVEGIPTGLFVDQADQYGEGPFALRGTLNDGRRYSGYRDVVRDGQRVAVVSVVASGNLVVTKEQIDRFADLQASCLASPNEPCEPSSAAGILGDESSTTVESPLPDGTYTDVNFGWSVDYAAAGWEYSSLEAGVILELQQGRNLASIEPVVNRHGDSERCLLEEVRLLETLEERASITLGSEVDDEPVAGNEAGHVWAIYTVEPLADERANQEYTIRIDCYDLIEGEASLVVHHSAPRDVWEQEFAKGDDLRANIDISGVAAATSDDDDAQVRIVDMMIPRIWIPWAA